MNAYIIASAVLAVICLVFMWPFLFAQRPGKSKKSLSLKMTAATAYLLAGILLFLNAKKDGGVSRFHSFMLLGLIASWLGDLFLHIPGKHTKKFFALGMAFFFSAHIIYTIAYSFGQLDLTENKQFLPIWGYCVVVGIIIAAIILLIIKKFHFGPVFIPFMIYGFILNTMMTKAVVFSLSALSSGVTSSFGAVLLSVGAVMFFLSDYSLAGIIAFKNKNFGVKIFNIVTYFVAQILLAYSIIAIG